MTLNLGIYYFFGSLSFLTAIDISIVGIAIYVAIKIRGYIYGEDAK